MHRSLKVIFLFHIYINFPSLTILRALLGKSLCAVEKLIIQLYSLVLWIYKTLGVNYCYLHGVIMNKYWFPLAGSLMKLLNIFIWYLNEKKKIFFYKTLFLTHVFTFSFCVRNSFKKLFKVLNFLFDSAWQYRCRII